jgi:prepilin-type N-terminal cleavage/methylation domain-containing protein
MGTRSPHAGFTLVELLVATSLIAVVLASVLPLFATAVTANVAARRRAVASLLASQKLEQLYAAADDAIGETVDYLDATGQLVAPREAVYTRRATVQGGTVLTARVVVMSAGGEVARHASARARRSP